MPSEKKSNAAFTKKLVSRTKPSNYTTLPASSTLLACSGLDIKKKPSRKGKTRLLFSFPGTLKPTSLCTGTLQDIHTSNPIFTLTLEPHGTLKLTGEIIYPKQTQYITLGLSSSSAKNITCDDVLTAVVTFPKVEFFNNDGKKVPIPSDLLQEEEFEASQAASPTEEDLSTDASVPPPPISNRSRRSSVKRSYAESDEASSSSNDDNSPIDLLSDENDEEDEKDNSKKDPSPIEILSSSDDESDNTYQPKKQKTGQHFRNNARRTSGRARKTVSYTQSDKEEASSSSEEEEF